MGTKISNLISATGSWGFKEWAIAIAGIIALLITLIALMDAVFNKGRGMERMIGNLTSTMNNIGGTTNRGRNIAHRYVSGSHRTGLDYVPRDNYIAELHEGERVLTKEENKRYSEGNGQIVNVYVQADDLQQVADVVRLFEDVKQVGRQGV